MNELQMVEIFVYVEPSYLDDRLDSFLLIYLFPIKFLAIILLLIGFAM